MKRLFEEGLVTTILGIAMLILAAVMYTVGKPMEEIIILGGWGFTFLRAKDSLIGLPTKNTNP